MMNDWKRLILPVAVLALALAGLTGCSFPPPGVSATHTAARVTTCYETFGSADNWFRDVEKRPKRYLPADTSVGISGSYVNIGGGVYMLELNLQDGGKCWADKGDLYEPMFGGWYKPTGPLPAQ